MSKFVLDTSALLAMFNGEPGAERVEAILDDSAISSVNLAELYSKVADKQEDLSDFAEDFADLSIPVVGFDDELAIASGRLREATRAIGLSLGDRACLATAASLQAVAVTTDRAWAGLDLPVRVEVIR